MTQGFPDTTLAAYLARAKGCSWAHWAAGAVTGRDSGGHRCHPSRGGLSLPVQEALWASVLSGEGAGCCLWSCEQLSAVRRVHFQVQRFCCLVPGLGVFLKVALRGHGPSHPACYLTARSRLS